jgi:hypothetical protein
VAHASRREPSIDSCPPGGTRAKPLRALRLRVASVNHGSRCVERRERASSVRFRILSCQPSADVICPRYDLTQFAGRKAYLADFQYENTNVAPRTAGAVAEHADTLDLSLEAPRVIRAAVCCA